VALLAAVLLAAGCSTGKDAVSSGSDFQFVSPDGKTEIFYEGADRKSIGELSGDDLLNEGKRISLSDFAGKVVVINIWGSWCGPCRVEAPQLQKAYDQTRDSGVVILGIDVHEKPSPAQDFVRDNKITYPNIYDQPGKSLLGLKGYPRSVVPSSIILDRSHRVAAVYLHDLLATDLVPLLERLTAEPEPRP
jgi:thiol-disulfide isomerase/thioredoxin